MKKILLKIENCRQCLYCSWDDRFCDNINVNGPVDINKDGTIPDWCPLDDYEESENWLSGYGEGKQGPFQPNFSGD